MALAQISAGTRAVITHVNQFYNLLKGVSGSGEEITLIHNADAAIKLQPSSDPSAGTPAIKVNNNAGTRQAAITFDGRFYAHDGAVGTPGITFDDDPDTGIYRTGANAMSVTAGGVAVSPLAISTVSAAGFASANDKKALTKQDVTDGTVTLDFASGLTVDLTSDANLVITLSNGVTGAWHAVVIHYTGTHTVTWSTTIEWENDTEPTWTEAANKTDIVALFYDGTNWYGTASVGFDV